MVNQGFFFTSIPDQWFLTFLGVMLLIAVVINTYVRHRALRPGRAVMTDRHPLPRGGRRLEVLRHRRSAQRCYACRVSPGEVLCLLGDNGAGKSTLIQILNGVIQPDTGQCEFKGETRTSQIAQ